ncbi:Importin subunit alpha-9 [Stylosanthes scabra]|uniref:Importin subunit alpha-9 n=1 Tax=Stylosanthes scabra TaxID=79078 RepID=A0ABU6R666_9FABA|nr:Importin subunit alpha-9 [Stylosanthes scabra]
MADPTTRRDAIKSSVGTVAATRRRQQAVAVSKERRESLVRAKRLCRVPVGGGDGQAHLDSDMIIDEEQSILDSQTSLAVEKLKSAVAFQGKGAMQKRVCLSFGSSDEQLLEAAWCLTNIAAGIPEETKALLPALPLLIAHLGEKSSSPVAEQCAWALGNVAGEGEELRNVLLAQGALLPLARMMLPNKGSTVRTAAWALSNLIKGPEPKAATELVRVDGVLDAIVRHLKKADDELATEVAWVVVYLSALSNVAMSLLVKNDVLQLLVQRLATSNSLQLLIPEAAWVLSNIAAGDIEHKRLIYSSEAVPLLLRLLSAAPFDIRKEVAYVLGNLCVAPTKGNEKPDLIVEHLISLVGKGCLPGFIDLVRSADIEAARLGLQFIELVLRGIPNGKGPKLVEEEDGIEAMERFQFHENEELRTMANTLVDKYFGEDYGLDDQ